MTIEERTAERKRRIAANVASSYEEAEKWDLEYWQRMTPQDRLSALVAIRRDVDKVLAARAAAALK
jgi:hypothetical protein